MSSKKALLSTLAMSLCISSLVVASELVVPRSAVMTAGLAGRVKVSHSDRGGFSVKHNGTSHSVASSDVEPKLRKISTENLAKYLAVAKLSVTRVGDDFAIRSHVPGLGGGVLGATIGAFLGKAAVSVVGHGAIVVVSLGATLVAGPVAGWAVATSLESTCGVAIEAASLKGAIAGGIAGGVATGPV